MISTKFSHSSSSDFQYKTNCSKLRGKSNTSSRDAAYLFFFFQQLLFTHNVKNLAPNIQSLILFFLLEEVSRPVDEVEEGEDEREGDAGDDVDPLASRGELGQPGLALARLRSHVDLALPGLLQAERVVVLLVVVVMVVVVRVLARVAHQGLLERILTDRDEITSSFSCIIYFRTISTTITEVRL